MIILTVEDSTTVSNLVRLSLKKADIECETAINGIEGLKKIKSRTPAYDLVLCDVNMPEMDGMEMLRQVRKSCPAYARVPFIFLTTSSDDRIKSEARSLGVKAWMKKPFTPESLIKTVTLCATPA